MTDPRTDLPKIASVITHAAASIGLAALTSISLPALAQVSIYQEQGKLIRAPQAVGALGADLFGDQINFYTGALEFRQTDVSLPGNDALPVAIGRHVTAGVFGVGSGLFGRWDLDIPHLHGIFNDQKGWVTGAAGAQPGQRCSRFAKPPMLAGSFGTGGLWDGIEYWHGSFLYVPGSGDQELLRRTSTNPHVPADGAAETYPYKIYPVVTRNLWAIKCLSSLANDTSPNKSQGEGFLATSPDGTQYRFDWMVSRPADSVEKGTSAPQTLRVSKDSAGVGETVTTKAAPDADTADGHVLARKEVWILPTKLTDRYGNTVTYSYDAANPWQLKAIDASDGRSIRLTYVPATNRVASVSDGTRTWLYTYSGSGPLANLDTVTLPDASQWHLLGVDALLQDVAYMGPPRCNEPGMLHTAALTGRLVHPSGAIGEFTLTPTIHGRAGVDLLCMNRNTVGEYAQNAKNYATNALTRKTISGPGVDPMAWTTSFPPDEGSWAPCSGCVATKVVEVTDPAGDKTRYTFGTLFRKNEGQLQRTEVIDAAGGSLRSAVTVYRDPGAGPFPNPMGISDQGRGDGELGSRLQVVEQRTVAQQGVDFTWQVNGLNGIDTMGRPVDVTRSSTLGHSRAERTAYFDHPGKWVLGQLASVTETGTGAVSISNTYHPVTATLTSIARFGRPEQSMTYYPDGTLKTRADGAGHTTTFSNYMRGIAQAASYADQSSESAVVNNIGLISSLTDAAGNQSTYEYDRAGRLHRITRPSGDLVAWLDTVIDFAPAGASEYGLDANHWRQTVTTGSATSVSYMDALWRPVLTRIYDARNESATRKMVVRRFDHRGQTTFESYPQRAIGYASDSPAGVATEYDALGRVTYSRADSELGTLTTATDYLTGFKKRMTNPRGVASTTSYQAFDEAREDAPVTIDAPEGLTVGIARDIFGKPISVTKSGGGASATRHYVYDANHRLCKTVEPETGATVQDYDSANNIAWRATGMALTSLACDRPGVAAPSKTTFGYDTLNRLTATIYGDASPGITRSYYADGMVRTVSSGGATWTTSYNKLRLPISEVLTFEGSTYTLGRTYDSNGNLNQLNYPTAAEGNPIASKSVGYTPNALGEPSQAGSFAAGIGYHPNGAIAGFTYGNGKLHALTQNLRGLPEVASDAGVLQDRYSYDQNGNVAAITDQLPASVTTRTLGYDQLDRLASAAAPGVWGSARYAYDVLDNITSSTIGSRVNRYDYDTRNRLKSLSSTVGSYGFAYGYDVRGNITSRGAQTYAFDQANRMTAATGRDTYRYDGYGHRVKTTAADGTITTSVYSPAGQLLYVTQRGGPRPAATTQYIYLRNHQIAEVKR